MKIFIAFFAAPIDGFNLATNNLKDLDCKNHLNGICTQELRQVCGNDGFTRTDPCTLMTEYCLGNINLEFSKWGPCKKTCPRMCPRNYRPTCASNGEEYSNECEFEKASCNQSNNWPKMPELTKVTCPPIMANDAINDVKEPECNTACGRFPNPICGDDRKTYPNECMLNMKNCQEGTEVAIAYTGQCCQEMCQRDSRPTCASNGVEYGNECEFEKASCHQSKDPEMPELTEVPCPKPTMANDVFNTLKEPKCKTACARDNNSICGGDGKTYPNECMLNMKNCQEGTEVAIVHQGKCCQQWCKRDRRPTCASNGVEYTNECEFEKASCNQSIDPEMPELIEVSCMMNDVFKEPECTPCTHNWRPICGNDDNTYSNQCSLNLKNCQEGTEVAILHKGKCQKTQLPKKCPDFCTRHYEPICSDDGTTYGTKCVLDRTNCDNPSTPHIAIAHTGECPKCPTSCQMDVWRPVCGSDGKTYSTKCVLDKTICDNPSMNLFKLYSGECMENDLSGEVKEVEEKEILVPHSLAEADCDYHLNRKCPLFSNQSYCGSDGVLYPHICHFRKARCLNPDLTVAKNEKVCKKKNKTGRLNFVNGRA